MQTKFIANLISLASARRSAEKPELAAPVELDAADLHLVGGGLAPRGGWQAAGGSTLVTTDATTLAPRGGW